MRKNTIRVSFIIIGLFFVIVACADNESLVDEQVSDTDQLKEANDMETLISTNERLVAQLEKELEEKEQLQERVHNLEDENRNLKDDILTYKQRTIEIEEHHERELSLRGDIDEISRLIFQFMDEANHDELEPYLSSNISIDRDNEAVEIQDDNGIERTFHYIKLNSVQSVYQQAFSLDSDEKRFSTEYEFETMADKNFEYEGGVELIFIDEEGWKLDSIRYVP